MSDLAELKANPAAFIERFFLLASTGKNLVLEPWQKVFLHDLLIEGDISLAILSTCKKQGKSTLAAAIALYVLFCFNAPVEVLFIANAKEQAKTLAFKTLTYACENSELARSCTVQRDRVIIYSTGAEARCLPTRAKTVAGLQPSLIIWDEAWGLTDEDEAIWSELTSIPTKRSISLVCSYAGLEGQSPLLRRLYDLGVSEEKPDDMLMFWSHDPKLSSWTTDAYLESQRRKLLPHQFSRLFENKWTSSAGAYIPLEDWEKCCNLELAALVPGASDLLYLGLDVGVKKDLSVLCGVTKEDDYYRLAYFRDWEPRGKGQEVELEAIYNHLLDMPTFYNIAGCWYDPKYMVGIAQRLTRAGVMTMHEVSPMPTSMSRIYEHFYQVVKARRFEHYGEKLLTEHIMNSVGLDGPHGIMLDKSSRAKGHEIDGAVAVSLACWGGSKHIETTIRVHRAAKQPRPAPVTPTSPNWTRLHKPVQRGRGEKMGRAISDIIKEASK